MHTCRLEYVWLDGNDTQMLRSKTKVLDLDTKNNILDQVPKWQFDGSSTIQAEGENSDCILQPVYCCTDPDRENGFLIMCEVLDSEGQPHVSNQRVKLRKLMESVSCDPWIGFEQEYVLFDGGKPIGWPEGGYPEPQGPFYCSVGANVNFGRQIVEKHMAQCIKANLLICGVNAEVMPGQWEFQIGCRENSNSPADPLTISDQLWIARYLLIRSAEDYGLVINMDPKPVKGDWNGSGMHTNFSTEITRKKGGFEEMIRICENLKKTHTTCISYYGSMLDTRLTGEHETAKIDEFSWGVAARNCSVRIPRSVQESGMGYFEDRRPGANADPYVVSRILLESIL